MSQYDFTKSNVFVTELQDSIVASQTITTQLLYINFEEPESLSVFFASDLSAPEETELNTIVSNHTPSNIFIPTDNYSIHVETWGEFKTLMSNKNMTLNLQYVVQSNKYRVFFVEDNIVWYHLITKVGSPDPGSDQEDFEDNYQADANKPLNPRDQAGKVIVNADGTHGPMLDYWVSAQTASDQAVTENRSWVEKKCWSGWTKDSDDPTGTEILDSNYTGCTATTIDLEVPHDIEVGGGEVHLVSGTSSRLLVDVILVPDVPSSMGGNVQAVQGAVVTASRPYKVEARSMKSMTYDDTYHTNKFRVVVHHAANEQADLDIRFHFYKDEKRP